MSKVIHSAYWDPAPNEDNGGEDWILCDGTNDRYADPKSSFHQSEVTCKRCLRILQKEKR